MKKVYCEECRNYCNFGICCTAGYDYNTKVCHHKETPFYRAYDERRVFTKKEMLKLNKNNNCKYYEEKI